MGKTVLILPDSEVWRELQALEAQVRYLLTMQGKADPQIFDSLASIVKRLDDLRAARA